MKITFAGSVLADASAYLPPLGMTLNGTRVAEVVDFARAAVKGVFSRGGAATTFSFSTSREFTSYADAQDAFFLAEAQAPVNGALTVEQTNGGGRPVLVLARSVLVAVVPALLGVRVDITYNFTGGRFTGGLPAGYTVDPDAPSIMYGTTAIPAGQESVAVNFPATIQNPVLGGLSIVAPPGSDSPGVLKVESLGGDGFTVFFTGAVPSAGFVLHWQAKPGPAA